MYVILLPGRRPRGPGNGRAQVASPFVTSSDFFGPAPGDDLPSSAPHSSDGAAPMADSVRIALATEAEQIAAIQRRSWSQQLPAGMAEAMVTGRMDSSKKARGAHILQREGLNASQAINMLYDRIIEDGGVGFIAKREVMQAGAAAWRNAAEFVDALSVRAPSRFDDMSKAEIRAERLKGRGLM